jgi:hypothetical protein
MNWFMRYKVTADFLPFRVWFISAESEAEARMQISKLHSIPYEQTEAKIDSL